MTKVQKNLEAEIRAQLSLTNFLPYSFVVVSFFSDDHSSLFVSTTVVSGAWVFPRFNECIINIYNFLMNSKNYLIAYVDEGFISPIRTLGSHNITFYIWITEYIFLLAQSSFEPTCFHQSQRHIFKNILLLTTKRLVLTSAWTRLKTHFKFNSSWISVTVHPTHRDVRSMR